MATASCHSTGAFWSSGTVTAAARLLVLLVSEDLCTYQLSRTVTGDSIS